MMRKLQDIIFKVIRYRSVNFLAGTILAAIFLSSCTEDITLDLDDPEAKLVVEGTIESGLPPFITLTQTVPFYGEINFNELDNYYAHDATVTVSDGSTSVTLTEYCLSELSDELASLVAAYLGFALDSLGNFPVDICMYADPGLLTGFPAIVGVPGRTYTLTINYNDKVYTSSTTIPELVNLDSVYVKQQPDPLTDSLYILYAMISDPDTLGNYYRYFTKQNSFPFYAAFSSVTDDLFFNGKTFEFSMSRGNAPTSDFDPATNGYFFSGDTVVLKFCTIDHASYEFFRSLEFDAGSDGPFSSATIVQTNISNGGLGVWCGYGVTYDTVYISE